MAELDANLIKNLNKQVEDLSKTLNGLEGNIKAAGEAMAHSFGSIAQSMVQNFQHSLRGVRFSELMGIDDAKLGISALEHQVEKLKKSLKLGGPAELVESIGPRGGVSVQWERTRKFNDGEELKYREDLVRVEKQLADSYKSTSQRTNEAAQVATKAMAEEENSLRKLMKSYNDYEARRKEALQRVSALEKTGSKSQGVQDQIAFWKSQAAEYEKLMSSSNAAIEQKRLQGVKLSADEEMRIRLAQQERLNKIETNKAGYASKEWKAETSQRTRRNAELDRSAKEYTASLEAQTKAELELAKAEENLRQKQEGRNKAGKPYADSTIKKAAADVEAARQNFAKAEQTTKTLAASLSSLKGGFDRLKQIQSAFGIAPQAEQEMQKIPTAFDRVIAQINQRAAQSGEQFAKRIVNAQGVSAEAKRAAEDAATTYMNVIRGISASRGQLPSGLLPWENLIKNLSFPNHLTEFGRDTAINSAINQLKGLQAAKDGISPQTYEALQKYREALERVVELENQRESNQRKYAANVSAVEGVTRRLNDNEAAIKKVQERWEELNVKKQAGLVNQKDFDAQTQKLLDDYDRLINKRKEFEIGDLGQMSFNRQREREEASRRFAQEQTRLAKEQERARLQAEREEAKNRAQSAKDRIAQIKRENKEQYNSIQEQIKLNRQITNLTKQYQQALRNTPQSQRKSNQDLKDAKAQLRKLLALAKEYEKVTPGSRKIAAQYLEYEKINNKLKEINTKHKEQKNSLESMLPTIQRLASAFGLAFSLQGLVQFGKKLVETRGEFEMQFVALKQIIGDVDEATKIWNQTMQQALQSPFKAMQLVDYTKKLAAYRIETDKLFDTTKRLADVSAGLGVDMGRLILAYGQVKTANYLRASEVRQFTEAGVNIYGNLAKYFSEIEGHAVSTAEVVERVSKRMVLFSDVEEIFRRMTSEGEAFFDMQRVQSDTIRGQINKLHDAYDQMLNTIGEGKQETIRDMVDTLNNLVVHWRDLAAALKFNVYYGGPLLAFHLLVKKGIKASGDATLWFSKALTGQKGVLLSSAKDIQVLGGAFKRTEREITIFGKKIPVFAGALRVGILATRKFQAAMIGLTSIFRTFLPYLAFEGVVWLYTKLKEASRAAKQLREDLENIATKNTEELDDEISRFELLRKKIENANEGTKERRDLMEQMNLKYGKYLGNINQETASAQELAKAYDQVATKIRVAAQERALGQLYERTVKETSDIQKEIVETLSDKSITAYDSKGGHRRIVVTKREAQDIAKNFAEAILNGENITIAGIAKKYYGVGGIALNTNKFSDITDRIRELREERLQFEQSVFEKAYDTQEERQSAEKRKQLYDDAVNAENDRYNKVVATLNTEKKDRIVINKAIEEEEERHNKIMAEIRNRYLLPEQGEKYDLDNFEKDYNERLKKALGYTNNTLLTDPRTIERYNRLASTLNNTQQGSTQRDKQIAESWKQATENLKRYQDRKGAGADISKRDENGVVVETAEQVIAQAKQEVEDWVLAAKLRGISLKEKSTGRSDNSIYGDRIRLLQDMLQKYKQAAKEAYGFAKAEEKTGESFEDAWNTIMPQGYGGLEVPTSYKVLAEMLTRLEEFTPRFNKDGKLNKAMSDLKKAIADALSNVDIEVSVRLREDVGRQMEEAFGNYELTLELQKLDLPKGLAADMWGIEELDISQLREKLESLFEGLKDEKGQLNTDAIKDYENYLNKINDLERKQQRERLKEYSKYLEYQYSERVKLEMDYVKKLARLEAETAIPEDKKEQIRQGLKKEYDEASRKQDWEDFKGGEFYVGMMEDLERQGTASLEVMRKKLEEMRANAKNLSPRALKEVVNALEKIDDIERGRTRPLERLKKAMDDLGDTNVEQLYKSLAGNQEQLAAQEEQMKNLEEMIMLENERNKLQEQGVTLEMARARLSEAMSIEATANKELREFNNDGTNGAQMTLHLLQQSANMAKQEREAAQLAVNALSTEYQLNKFGEKNPYRGKSIQELNKEKEALEEQKKENEDNIATQQKLVKIAEELQRAWHDTLENVKDYAQRIGGVFEGVTDTVDYFADSTSSLAVNWKEFGSTAVSSISDLVSGIQDYQKAMTEMKKKNQEAGLTEALMSGDLIKLALVVLGVLLKIIQTVAKMNDTAIDKQIERSRQKVEELQRAYERLEKSIERAFRTTRYMADFNKQVENLHQQIAEAERQAAAAQGYKDQDAKREALRDAEDSKQQALDMLDEIRQKQIETFGGVGRDNYRSWAEGFVSAWKDAFLETGDGLDALNEHFDEFLQEWFVKQATMRAAGAFLEPYMQEIDAMVANGNVDYSRLQTLVGSLRDAFPELNEILKQIIGEFDLDGMGQLSGLAAGIQGMTEQQADVLEAYWNSVRMYTANIDMNVARIATALGVGADTPNTNPMLQQMTIVAQKTTGILSLLEAVSTNNGLGRGLRVYTL